MSTFTGYPAGSIVRWFAPALGKTCYGTVIESNEQMTLVRCEFTGWIETERLEVVAPF